MEKCPRRRNFVCTMDKCFNSDGVLSIQTLAAGVEVEASAGELAVLRCCIRLTAAIYVNR